MSSVAEEPTVSGGQVMTFREHLRELRDRLVRVVLVLIIGFFVCWEFRVEIFGFLSRPIANSLADNGVYHFQAIQITESVLVYLKTALFADLLLISPFIFWQLWSFIGPGLLPKERRFIIPLTAFSVVFFLIGSAFSYNVLLPFITDWLIQLTYDSGNVEVLVTLQNAYSFAFTFLLMFGLVFELPLVIFFLALFGAATGKGLLKFWRYFVVLSTLISAILTPPDPISQIMMAIPLNVLYGFGVLVAFSITKARASDAKNVGSAALRMMALTLAGAIAVGVAAFLVIRSIPSPPLTAWVPDDAHWVIGMNPRVVVKDLGDAVDAVPEVTTSLAGLAAAGLDPEALTDALLIRTDSAPGVVALVRYDGIAELVAPLRAALAPDPGAGDLGDGSTEGRGDDAGALVVTVLDGNTIAIGPKSAVATIAAVLDNDRTAPVSDETGRLLKRLRTSGPIWAWLPTPGGYAAVPMLGDAAAEAADAGISFSLKTGRFGLHLRATSEERSPALDASLESARSESLRAEDDRRLAEVVSALKQLTQQVKHLSPAADRKRFGGIETTLAQLEAPHDPTAVPVVHAVAPYAKGLSIERKDAWYHVIAELDDRGTGALMALIVKGIQTTGPPPPVAPTPAAP